MTDTDKLIERMRMLEIDHEPDGWPAVQQRDISALCDAVEGNNKALERLQARLEAGARIEKRGNAVWLVNKDGHISIGAPSLRTMLMNLIFTEC